MARRVLLLGSTGIDKRLAIARLRQYRESVAEDAGFTYIDLESDFVAPRFRGGMSAFLDADDHEQWVEWRSAWREMMSTLDASRDTVLGIHAVLARQLYGIRTVAYLDDICQYGPTHLVTLIEDVYFQRERTETRAQGQRWRGQPTLSNLLEARRSELLIGDTIHRNLDPDTRLTNWLLAVRHPARLLDRLLFARTQRLVPLYLSFPISEPRRMLASGDASGTEAVSSFLAISADLERRLPHVIAFSPLSIDELPLLAVAESSIPQDPVVFEVRHRWDVRQYYGTEEILLTDTPADPVSVPRAEIDDAAGLIRGDVARRDYRLVKQASRLVVYCPVFNGQLSTGVENEIVYGIRLSTPIHVYQDPAHDPRGIAVKHYLGQRLGALGMRPGAEYIKFHGSIKEALEAAAQP